MASPSSSLSSPLHLHQLLRYTPPSPAPPSTRLGGPAGAVHRRPLSPYSARIMQPATKGPMMKSVMVAAASSSSYHDEAGGHGGDNNSMAAAASLLHNHHDVVDDEGVTPPELLRIGSGGGALCSPKGRSSGSPGEEGGGGRIIHSAAAPTIAKRARGPAPPGLPKEGSGGNGGSKH